MQHEELLKHPTYDPDRLIDTLIAKLGLKSDAALSRALKMQPPVISKIRNRVTPVGATILLRIHEVTGISFKKIRILLKTKRKQNRDYNPPALRAEKLRRLTEKAASHSGTCISDVYVNVNVPLLFECKTHGIFKAKPRHILAGHWCRKCVADAQKGDAPLRLASYIAERGGVLKSPYVNARTHVVVACKFHGEWKALPDNLVSKGTWCPRCARSKPRPRRKKQPDMNSSPVNQSGCASC